MPRNYVPHPPKGYSEFLTFIIRYAYFNGYDRDNNGSIETTINQDRVGNFLKKDQTTISRYISKAMSEG